MKSGGSANSFGATADFPGLESVDLVLALSIWSIARNHAL